MLEKKIQNYLDSQNDLSEGDKNLYVIFIMIY